MSGTADTQSAASGGAGQKLKQHARVKRNADYLTAACRHFELDVAPTPKRQRVEKQEDDASGDGQQAESARDSLAMPDPDLAEIDMDMSGVKDVAARKATAYSNRFGKDGAVAGKMTPHVTNWAHATHKTPEQADLSEFEFLEESLTAWLDLCKPAKDDQEDAGDQEDEAVEPSQDVPQDPGGATAQGKDEAVEPSQNVPVGGNQGPHTIAHVMTEKVLRMAMPSVFPPKPKDAVIGIPQGSTAPEDANIHSALRMWDEVELFWINMETASGVRRIVDKETAGAAIGGATTTGGAATGGAATTAGAATGGAAATAGAATTGGAATGDGDGGQAQNQRSLKAAADAIKVSYTEWFNRIEASLSKGRSAAIESIEAGEDEDAVGTAQDSAADVACMIHHLWTLHPYATYCWQDDKEANEAELGGKGERGKKIIDPMNAYLKAKQALSDNTVEMRRLRTAREGAKAANDKSKEAEEAIKKIESEIETAFDEVSDILAEIKETRKDLSNAAADMIDHFAIDHVKSPESYWKYIKSFASMLDPDANDQIFSQIKRRLGKRRLAEKTASDAWGANAGSLDKWKEGEEDPNKILDEFPACEDVETAGMMAYKMRKNWENAKKAASKFVSDIRREDEFDWDNASADDVLKTFPKCRNAAHAMLVIGFVKAVGQEKL